VGTGRIPLTVHGLLEYGIGVLSILAPFLFGFNDQTAPTLVSVLLGAAVLVMAVLTDAPTGVSRTLPMPSHQVLDYVLVLVFIASPFVFGFSDRGAALAYFLAVGVGHLLVTVNTRFRVSEVEI
jgi:hypothetical protein